MKESDINSLAQQFFYEGNELHGTLIETHISWVILTKKYAFKLKKPIKLSFLDFSTLELRKKYCERELTLNSRFSGIYLSVVPVYMREGKWVIENKDDVPLDYVLIMHRMATNKRMDYLLAKNKVDGMLMEALAEEIVDFHKKATPIFIPYNAQIAKDTFNDIFKQRDFVLKELGQTYADIIDQAIKWSDDFLALHAPRIQQRIDHGLVRDVHGDLHSGNIFLYKLPVLFDCVEFNDEFRQIDLIYEIAFLCMDLEAFQQKQLADDFLAAYKSKIACFEVKEDDALFVYYKCLRANIRAKVHALSCKNAHDNTSFKAHLSETKTYLLLMQQYLFEI